MKEQKIKAVIFDVGGVLRTNLDGDKNHSGIHDYVAKKLRINSDSWFDAIDSVYADSIIGKASREKFLTIVSRNLNVSKKKLISLIKEAYEKKFRKNKRLYEFAFSLKKKGYKIGILSDQWALSKENLIPKQDKKGFDVVVISCDVGARKPNLKIYNLLIKKLKEKDKKIKKNEILFIDNREWNLKPARKLGMNVLLFKNNNQLIKKLGII